METLEIQNFKCFNSIEVPLNQLTILAGANGKGKSTVIQALLLLRTTIEQSFTLEKNNNTSLYKRFIHKPNIPLNDSYCLSLGNSTEIIPKNAGISELKFSIKCHEKQFYVTYAENLDPMLWIRPEHIEPIDIANENCFASLFCQEFYYLNAERIGPRVSQSIKSLDFNHAGYKGEYIAQLLGDTEFYYRFEVEESRRNKNSNTKRLDQQVNEWLDEIMPGTSVSSFYDINTLTAQVRIGNTFTQGEDSLATNIGFGISYILPIIINGLIAKKGSLFIVENPEAHLHPSAQSKIGRFLSIIAESGVQVIVETHSDHFINGVQVSCAKGEIDYDKVNINFFSEVSENLQPKLESISVNKLGELSHWPRGFFDQTQVDFAELFKIRRG